MSTEPTDWVTRAADDAIRHAGEGNLVTVASGASPSGPIHLGNLREFLTPHFVAEELRRRGVPVRHLHSWDDYDRFRKVPAGVPAEWATHIGRPLTAVPDPWECHDSWAAHFKAPLEAALAEMGVEVDAISQTEHYKAGAYRDQILLAVSRRHEIETVLAQHRTKPAATAAESEQEAEALADSVADDEEATGTGDLARFPFKPYCRDCGRDTTTITSYDDETTDLAYHCNACSYDGVTNLTTENEGKLVWKVDWPMRWAYERVNFEPAGLDHMTPGSSYTVGQALVGAIFDWKAPSRVTYAFVGFAGVQKMSSSAGGVPTAADALRVLEAPMLRWLYVRRQPRQAFTIDFGAEVVRLYDEWDALTKKAADPARRDAQVLAHERAVATASAGVLPRPAVTVPFRLLSSVADVTAGSPELISRVVTESGYEHNGVPDLEPRLSKAATWMTEYVPSSDRTTVRTTPSERLSSLSPEESAWLTTLLDALPSSYELEPVTSVIYGVPKLVRGMSLDDAPTDEVKADQKAFFKLLYNLLVDADRGPRLPTLFLALGPETVRSLLTPA
ncbi:lysine--tRNA ligase [Nocardioides sp. CER19]|uniref:lysine--tRNA ligase n=1 Tax=Nocardioides sp. CER19 TaxID=3038538 RepID=UPI00244B09E1|nr:lysine--tRNA ligase [Nocardioides sp. CER19]MDH2413275.1 lysine--tRNA ligase [Nocardioides sp. CER19]